MTKFCYSRLYSEMRNKCKMKYYKSLLLLETRNTKKNCAKFVLNHRVLLESIMIIICFVLLQQVLFLADWRSMLLVQHRHAFM